MNFEAKQRAAASVRMGGGTDYQAHEDRPRVCPDCGGTKLREVDPGDEGYRGEPRMIPCTECDEDGRVG